MEATKNTTTTTPTVRRSTPPPPRAARAAQRAFATEDTAVARVPRPSERTIAAVQVEHRLYLNESWYLMIDDQGYLTGSRWAEGALGCVIQLHADRGGNKMALKIPRLLADTVRENAFIAELLDHEEEIVHYANVDAPQPSGLLRVQLAHRNPLRGLRQLANQDETIRAQQHEGVIFVAFEKGRPPRFCNVRRGEAGLELYPPGVAPELGAALQGYWDAIRQSSARLGLDRPFQRTVFVRTSNGAAPVLAGALEERIDTTSDRGTWYAGLPSIIFDWARGTLQEAVTRGDNVCAAVNAYSPARPWALRDHYSMLLIILRGLDVLHSREIIHGDLRPANIMCMGDFRSPDTYVLGDYGGTVLGRASVEDSRASTGHTATGPSVGNHRSSVFYGPERRSGIERETADTAIILHESAGSLPEYFIVLGWKAELIGDDGRLRADIRRDLHDRWSALYQRSDPPYSEERLRAGDRIHLRDFVFTVIDSQQSPDGLTLLRCSTRFARVVHDRLAVIDRQRGIPDGAVISLARSIELRKWTAATDLYGVGVLALWSIFMSNEENRRGAEGASAGELARSVETRLQELVEHLASLSSFYDLWPMIGRCARALHQITHHHPLELIERMHLPGSDTRLVYAVEEVVHVLSCLPHGRELLRCFDFNGAHFVLFVHFVMACIHRRVYDLPDGDGAEVPEALLPFCVDRHEPPRADGPAARARHHLLGLLDRLDMPAFSIFVDLPGASNEQANDELHRTSSALIVHRLRKTEERFQHACKERDRELLLRRHCEEQLRELLSLAKTANVAGWQNPLARLRALRELLQAAADAST
ncbi:MAG: protein kinase family protein [Nannocystis sp.]|nr:protein kinase family protein [Nannocystis sp.]